MVRVNTQLIVLALVYTQVQVFVLTWLVAPRIGPLAQSTVYSPAPYIPPLPCCNCIFV